MFVFFWLKYVQNDSSWSSSELFDSQPLSLKRQNKRQTRVKAIP